MTRRDIPEEYEMHLNMAEELPGAFDDYPSHPRWFKPAYPVSSLGLDVGTRLDLSTVSATGGPRGGLPLHRAADFRSPLEDGCLYVLLFMPPSPREYFLWALFHWISREELGVIHLLHGEFEGRTYTQGGQFVCRHEANQYIVGQHLVCAVRLGKVGSTTEDQAYVTDLISKDDDFLFEEKGVDSAIYVQQAVQRLVRRNILWFLHNISWPTLEHEIAWYGKDHADDEAEGMIFGTMMKPGRPVLRYPRISEVSSAFMVGPH